MSRMKVLKFVNLVIILSMAGYSLLKTAKPEQRQAPKQVQITEDGNACGSAVGLNAGDTLDVILNGDPSTGYSWTVGFYTPSVIKPTGEPEYLPDSQLLGAVGTYTFQFLAIGEGQSVLRLIYSRQWEEDTPEIKTCEITVQVGLPSIW